MNANGGFPSLPPPEADLEVSVVVPAKNEEARIRACLAALASQTDIESEAYEVLLVLDDCTDSTKELAEKVRRENPNLRLHFLEGPGRGVGNARRLGMESACERLVSVGRSGGLISSTDADSVVARDWLAAQRDLARGGAEAIGGKIDLAEDRLDLPEQALRWYEFQSEERRSKVFADYAGREDGAAQEHWQFSGASMSLTAETYLKLGGLEPMRDLEDEHLERILEDSGIRIVRSRAVRVRTSARTRGRAERGLASSLDAASRTTSEVRPKHPKYRVPDSPILCQNVSQDGP